MLTYVDRAANEREVHCRCEKCGNLCDGIFQIYVSDEWKPSPLKTLETLGWIRQDERWFCSKYCRDVFANMVAREEPIKPVLSLASPLGPTHRAYAKK